MIDPSSLRKQPDNPVARPTIFAGLFPLHGDIAVISIVAIWGLHLAYVGVRVFIAHAPDPGMVLMQHISITGLSVFLSWSLYRALILMDRGDDSTPLLLLTVPALLMAVITSYAELAIMPDLAGAADDRTGILLYFDAAFLRYLLFVSWGILYWSLVRNRSMKQTVDNNRYLAKLTRDSEIRALRFQLNPHFVFNALNSVSSLIVEHKNSQAETLVDGLADYMREVLTAGDGHLVTVEQEIAQQLRYLEIEKVRFPNRLRFEATISEAIREWRIPALIIQPLIENAIKYGVAKSTSPVNIILDAKLDDGRLHLSVSNDGRMMVGTNKAEGTGTGLINVRERLAAIYGSTAALEIANVDKNRITACIIIPTESQISEDS